MTSKILQCSVCRGGEYPCLSGDDKFLTDDKVPDKVPAWVSTMIWMIKAKADSSEWGTVHKIVTELNEKLNDRSKRGTHCD